MTEEREVRPDDLTAREIADAVWLASSTGRRRPGTGGPVPGPRDASAPEHTRADDTVPTPDPFSDAHRTAEPPPSGEVPPPADTEARPTPAARGPAAAEPPRFAPGPTTLDEPLALARALRPLRARSSVRERRFLLDEDATAHRIAETGLWLPEFRDERARPWGEAVLVVDDSPSMALWDGLDQEVGRLLGRLDVFRRVRTLRLATGPDDANAHPDGPPGTPELRAHARPVPWESLTRSAGGHVVLVLTDGLGPAWHSGAMEPLLHRIGRAQTLAVVHTMPARSWPLTGITTASVLLRRGTPPPANSALRRVPGLTPYDDADAAALPVPVLRLEPRSLRNWARLVAAPGDPGPVPLPVMTVGTTAQARPGAEAAEPAGGEAVVRRARAVLPAETFELAVRLAAVPLTLPVIRAVQHHLAPGTHTQHLAELVGSGLLRHEPDSSADGTTHFPFAFRPGTRGALLAYATRQDTWQAVQILGRAVALEDRTDAQRFLLATLDGHDAVMPAVTDANHEALAETATVLDALAGPYRAPARKLRSALLPASAPAAADAGSGRVPPTVWGNVPPRNRNFTGRTEHLAAVHDSLAGGGTQPAVHALTGMGGVGKTQIAVEYIYRHSAEYDHVWWLSAANAHFLAAGLREFAQAMRLPVEDGPAAVGTVLEALRSGAVRGSWLLVFDNAEDVEGVRPFIPLGGTGAVLVTTRNGRWAHAAPTTDVDVFHREESTELLGLRSPHVNLADADALAEALGDLPLAVEQASVWLYDTGMPVREYLNLFEQRVSEILESPPLDYPIGINTVWRISLDRVHRANPAALELLNVLAWLDPTPVPLAAIRTADAPECIPRDPVLLARTLRLLNRYALVRIDHRNDTVQLHRLLSRHLQGTMPPEARSRSRQTARHLNLTAHSPTP